MERRFERVKFDDINDDKFLGVEQEQEPKEFYDETPGRTTEEIQREIDLIQAPSNLVRNVLVLLPALALASQLTIEVSKATITSGLSRLRSKIL